MGHLIRNFLLAAISSSFAMLSWPSPTLADSIRGEGRLDMTPTLWAGWQKYSNLWSPESFALNPSNGGWYATYCPDTGQCSGSAYDRAVRECDKRTGGGCKLFARGKQIVWRGPVCYQGRLISGEGADCASPPVQSSVAEPAPRSSTAPKSVAGTRSPGQELSRPIAFQWDGVADLAAGEVSIRPMSGDFVVTLPNGKGGCSGSYVVNDSQRKTGAWRMSCETGDSALGTFVAYGEGKGASGEGRDGQGRRVRFTIGGQP